MDGEAVERRRFDDGEIFESAQAHLKRPWNRCGRHGETIHAFAHGLDFFFVSDAESVLFVNDEQAEILKNDVL